MPARFVEAGSDAAEAVCAKGSQELPAGIRVLVAHQRRKEHRHILADSAGMLVAAAVTGGQRPGPSRLPQTPPAGETGRTDNRPRLAGQGLHRHNAPRQPPEPASASTSCPVRKPDGGFRVQPRRWVVERTNGWINDCRRLDRHYEVTLAGH